MNVMHSRQTDRRNFIKKSVQAAGTLLILPRHILGGKGFVSPSDRINIGIIGTGKKTQRGYKAIADFDSIQIISGCDVDQQKLNWFKTSVEDYYGSKTGKSSFTGCQVFTRYEELLARPELDAVVIATPDHWHAIMAIESMKAGKDVYCEKPMAHTIEEGRAMVKASMIYERVFQTGSQQRSSGNFRQACELVRNNYLGEINKILVQVGDPAVKCNLKGEAIPGYLDWNRWIGPAPYVPYHPLLSPPIDQTYWAKWRDYEEFGGGIFADWGAHMFDIAQWALGMDKSGPVKIIPPEDPSAVRGLTFVYGNNIEMVHEDFGRGFAIRFIGSDGTLDVSRGFIDSKPENIANKSLGKDDIRLYKSDDHFGDWVQAIRSRSRPCCDAETGHRSASICIIGNMAYKLKRTLAWDPVKEKFIKDAEANKMRSKKYRDPFVL